MLREDLLLVGECILLLRGWWRMMSKFDQLVRGSQEEKTSWWQLTHRALVDDASSTDVEEESSVGTEVQWAS